MTSELRGIESIHNWDGGGAARGRPPHPDQISRTGVGRRSLHRNEADSEDEAQ